VGGTHDDGTRTASEGEEAQAAESVGDELKAPKADGFPRGKPSPEKCSPLVMGMNANDGIMGMA
jgi:hypothetical protein